MRSRSPANHYRCLTQGLYSRPVLKASKFPTNGFRVATDRPFRAGRAVVSRKC
jgi:hypothetical protein